MSLSICPSQSSSWSARAGDTYHVRDAGQLKRWAECTHHFAGSRGGMRVVAMRHGQHRPPQHPVKQH
jgi:hypothetical protein